MSLKPHSKVSDQQVCESYLGQHIRVAVVVGGLHRRELLLIPLLAKLTPHWARYPQPRVL